MKRHLFLDFFGTLVQYSPAHVGEGYVEWARAVEELDLGIDPDAGLRAWSSAFTGLLASTQRNEREFSMHEVGARALTSLLGRAPSDGELDRVVDAYLVDWQRTIVNPPGMVHALERLAAHCTLTVVSNTHDHRMVPWRLDSLGAGAAISHLVTSIEVGFRKPNAAMYRAALDVSGARPEEVAFVGDTLSDDVRGPREHGFESWWISSIPDAEVSEDRRLESLLELPDRLGV